MNKLNLPTEFFEIAVVSDVHISSPDDIKYDYLCEFCDQIKTQNLVLNGDIFEFFIGDRIFFFEKYKKLFKILTVRAEQGCRVIFNQGNHEYFLQDLKKFCPEIEFQTCDFKIGDNFFTHGDEVQKDLGYKVFKTVTRSIFTKILARIFLASFALDFICQKIAKFSRKKDCVREFNAARILTEIRLYGEKFKQNTVVVGHFHYPFAEKEGLVKVFSVKDWPFEINFLGYKSENWCYYKLKT